MNITSKYFKINQKEYCHITDNEIFIFNSKEPHRIPIEHNLGEGWGILSVLNYIGFVLLFFYIALSITNKGALFFYHPLNYGVLLLLFLSLMRVKSGFITSRTPTIPRNKIRSAYFKTPFFSYARLVIYFDGPEGKVLRRTIPVLYKQEALSVLQECGLVQ